MAKPYRLRTGKKKNGKNIVNQEDQGDLLRSWRKSLRYTQVKAAELLGVSRRTIINYEQNKKGAGLPEFILLFLRGQEEISRLKEELHREKVRAAGLRYKLKNLSSKGNRPGRNYKR